MQGPSVAFCIGALQLRIGTHLQRAGFDGGNATLQGLLLQRHSILCRLRGAAQGQLHGNDGANLQN